MLFCSICFERIALQVFVLNVAENQTIKKALLWQEEYLIEIVLPRKMIFVYLTEALYHL